MLKNPAAFLTILLTLLFAFPARARVERVIIYFNKIAVAIDGAGNTYVTGSFIGSLAFGSKTLTNLGRPKMFVRKFDPKGKVLWSKNMEGSGCCEIQGITVDKSGNCFIVGKFSDTIAFGERTLVGRGADDIFVASFNSSGDVLWVQKAGGNKTDQGHAIAVDTAGNCYVTGTISDTLNSYVVSKVKSRPGLTVSRQRDMDMFIAKYSPSGNLIWSRVVDHIGYDIGKSIAVDKAGNCYVTGEAVGEYIGTTRGIAIILSKYDPLGNEVWTKKFSPKQRPVEWKIAMDDSGHCWLAAAYGVTGCYSCAIHMAKYDTLGNPIWEQDASASRDGGTVSAIALDWSGNVIITGNFCDKMKLGRKRLQSKGSCENYLAKLDAAGQPVWLQKDGGKYKKQWTDGSSMVTDASGNIFVTGFYSDETIAGLNRIFIAKYDASGNLIWRKTTD